MPPESESKPESKSEPEPLLRVRGLGVRFGGLQALANLSFAIQSAELIGIIGPNGAGKTTLFHAMSGIVTPTHGRLWVDGVDLTGRPPQIYCRRGIARTFQTPRVFRSSTALENVAFGIRFARRPGSAPAPAEASATSAKGESNIEEQALSLLQRVDLAGSAQVLAGALPPARQRLLEIAMALGTRPRLLLLDEVAAGLTETEADRTAVIVRELRDELRIAVVWIEHAVGKLMRTVDRMLVLNHGELIADGPPATVAADKRVIDAYLGVDEQAAP
jgi:branched-chain amino acid transport system ATP-binding protein